METTDNPEQSRSPEQEDLVSLCRELNAQGVRYLIIGGYAIIHHGFARGTEDIDLLVEKSHQNLSRVIEVLSKLPDHAASVLTPAEIEDYVVVRVADAIVVDIMLAACGLDFIEASKDAEVGVYDGVSIPFASKQTLLRMKQTYRDKDEIDRIFLRNALSQNKKNQSQKKD